MGVTLQPMVVVMMMIVMVVLVLVMVVVVVTVILMMILLVVSSSWNMRSLQCIEIHLGGQRSASILEINPLTDCPLHIY